MRPKLDIATDFDWSEKMLHTICLLQKLFITSLGTPGMLPRMCCINIKKYPVHNASLLMTDGLVRHVFLFKGSIMRRKKLN